MDERLLRHGVEPQHADTGDPGAQFVGQVHDPLGQGVRHPSTVSAPACRNGPPNVPESPRTRAASPPTVVTMILVTGATGTIGSEVVRQFAARGEKVRALTRDPERAGLPSGVEAVRGHPADRASVEAALTGAEAAFLVGVFGPDDAEHDRGLVEAARA